MSTIRTPKVSERVAPKPADPQPEQTKRGEDDDGPAFRTLLNAWLGSHRATHAARPHPSSRQETAPAAP